MSNGVKAWSYSALSLYEQCPLKYKLTKIDKLDEPRSDALKRGTEVHDQCDKFITGQLENVPECAATFEKEMIELKSFDPFTEQEWAFRRNWSITHWRDWKGCWLRGKLDVGVDYPDNTGDFIDFKTGKPKDDYYDQLHLFGTMWFIKFPKATHVQGRLWYLDSGDETDPEMFYREDFAQMKGQWEERVQPMFNDTIFAAKPNRFCNWCHFRKSNGGPCKHA